MSLSSILLTSKTSKIDTELDALFKSNPSQPLPSPAGPSERSAKKRKPELEAGLDADNVHSKRRKSKSENHPKVAQTVEKPSERKTKTQEPKPVKQAKLGDKGKARKVEEVSDEEEDNSDLERTYLHGKKDTGTEKAPETDSENSENSDDEGTSNLVHESLREGKKARKTGRKIKYVPAEETAEMRDTRTIFIGNLPVEVAQKKSLLKQLHRHILAQIPSAKIESTRFRSIAFQNPTSKLPTSDDEGSPSKSAEAKADATAAKQGRQHDKDRASSWRDRQPEDDESSKSDEKKFLTPKQKKKIAFINQEFHSTADTINAYVVFAHALPADARPANLPPLPAVLDPFEAAKLAVEQCDGSTFMDRMIRVDVVNKKGGETGKQTTQARGTIDGDPKLCVFVGNLDFASKEEDLRIFFEGLVSAERGPPGEEDSQEDTKKPKTWVTRVRIVRDKETQLGKGFAYIQFADRECVDEVLAMEETKLKFAKRKLRVQRCKTLPGASTSTRQATSSSLVKGADRPAIRAPPVPIVVPKGDPLLGEKLVHLSKDARKQVKASDADRVARRLAKKKARMALGNAGLKSAGKDRERVRKGSATKKAGAVTVSKGRVRSDKSVMKRNTKK